MISVPDPVPAAPFISGVLTWDNGGATIAAACIAAIVVLVGYTVQQAISRRSTRSKLFAEAIRTAHDYLEAPYLVRRRDGSAGSRISITTNISDIQSRLAFYQTVLRVQAPRRISDKYDLLVSTIKKEAGPAISEAWTLKPTRRDRDVPIGAAYDFPNSRAALEVSVKAMTPQWRRA